MVSEEGCQDFSLTQPLANVTPTVDQPSPSQIMKRRPLASNSPPGLLNALNSTPSPPIISSTSASVIPTLMRSKLAFVAPGSSDSARRSPNSKYAPNPKQMP